MFTYVGFIRLLAVFYLMGAMDIISSICAFPVMTSQNLHFEKGLWDRVDVSVKTNFEKGPDIFAKQILNSICQKLEIMLESQ